MFEKLFGSNKELFVPRMPEVDVLESIENVFRKARETAADSTRNVVIVTPGRLLRLQPCPPAGSMDAAQVAGIEKLISAKVKRNIAVIGYNELHALQKDVTKAVPFIGMLMAFSYIGHSVWVFEGHASALEAGSRDADILIADSGMVPHLPEDWKTIPARGMKRPEIYIHDRTAFSLRRA